VRSRARDLSREARTYTDHLVNQPFTETEQFGRDRLLQALRRWAPLVALSAILAGVAAFGVSMVLPPQYRATAQLFVAPAANPAAALQEVILGQNLARSYVQLATAEVVLQPAMLKVNWTDLEDFRRRTDVAQLRDTFVINISFDLDDPVRASAAANAIAESFVAQSRTVQATLQAAVSIWQPATPPIEPESPRVILNTVLGALGGALVALVILGALSYLDDRITDFEQIRSRLGIAPLEEIFKSARPETMAGKLFVRDTPQSREAEAFRSLRTNISFANVDKRPRSILVTSALPSEGKSIVSANLALALAQEGTPTVLIDADLRRPAQHTLFKLSGTHGLTSLLTGQLPLDGLQRFRVSEHLLVIPTGPIPPNPAELLSSQKMTAVIEKLISIADGCTVVIDTSPVLAVADPLALSTKVDGCLLVLDAARANTRATRRAIARLKAVNATILGAVLNKVSTAHSYYGYRNYRPDELGPADLDTPTVGRDQEPRRT
jgi:succinoglycan biosynthesis transport protein ExoP